MCMKPTNGAFDLARSDLGNVNGSDAKTQTSSDAGKEPEGARMNVGIRILEMKALTVQG